MTYHLAAVGRRQILQAGVAALCVNAMAPLLAQDRPPLRILVGFPPGGSADVVARAIGEAMREDLGSVIVENKPGAAGRIAIVIGEPTLSVANSRYSLICSSVSPRSVSRLNRM